MHAQPHRGAGRNRLRAHFRLLNSPTRPITQSSTRPHSIRWGLERVLVPPSTPHNETDPPMRLNDMKLGARLGLGFGVVLLLAALIALVGWLRLADTLGGIGRSHDAMARATTAQRWESLTLLNVNRTLAIAKSDGHPEVKAHFAPMIKETSAEISQLQKSLETAIASDKERAQFQDIADKRKVYVGSRDAIFGLLEIDDPGAKEALNDQLMPAAGRYLDAIHAFQLHQRELADLVEQDTTERAEQARIILMLLGAVCLIIGASFAWLITRSVTRPLHHAAEVTRIMASGDLSRTLDLSGRDEVATLVASLNDMQGALRGIVHDIRVSTDSIATASSEVAAGSMDLSGRTEQAASSLEQTASSMEEISGTIRHTADSARVATQLAQGAVSAATQGGAVVSQVMSTMQAITESSKRIGDIIAVIDGIAFQTNILALNAAVEAARAGEQGRGFAVVAGEVRALAHRVAEAAKEVRTLISASVEQVSSGSALVQDAGASMNAIVDSVQRVNDIIDEISTAASQQSDGISQVNVAVTQMDQMTQQNAALVEQSAAAAESLKDQSSRLTEVISVFRLPA
ncbi:MAG: HAMP domain-containing protein [Burkholderiales bacterium]|nr:HAMP domain-containing protein [Burkholderiales bacterium]MBH2017086.1 HAMP domain-containing protein [Burkholderiales bacterium]